MRPEDRARQQQNMRDRLAVDPAEQERQAECLDLAQWIRAVQGRLAESEHDFAKIAASPDEIARNYKLAAVPMAIDSTSSQFSRTVGRSTNIVLIGPEESPPENAIETITVAEARFEALSSRAAARRAAGDRGARTRGVPVGRS